MLAAPGEPSVPRLGVQVKFSTINRLKQASSSLNHIDPEASAEDVQTILRLSLDAVIHALLEAQCPRCQQEDEEGRCLRSDAWIVPHNCGLQ